MNILVGISGSIAAYKACSLVSLLSKKHYVKVMMTENAMKFVTPLTFEALSKNSVITKTLGRNDGEISHIYYPQEWADLIIVAPATADIIGKAANGIADDIVTSCLIAASVPVIFVPAMNAKMYHNTFVQGNIKKLENAGMYFVEPDTGMLACGKEGEGKYPETKKIIDTIKYIKKGFGV